MSNGIAHTDEFMHECHQCSLGIVLYSTLASLIDGKYLRNALDHVDLCRLVLVSRCGLSPYFLCVWFEAYWESGERRKEGRKKILVPYRSDIGP